MKFYQAIAKYYDQIFPLNSAQLPFTLNALAKKPKEISVLDVGCATGNFPIALRNAGVEITAFDLDQTMIQLARKKAPEMDFRVLDMLELTQTFSDNSFDIVSCYGNTLVHLDSAAHIHDFLEQAYRLLKPGGKLLLQILNYDYILDTGITCLPHIENEQLQFERSYRRLKSDKLAFETRLSIKSTAEIFENSVALLPLR
ncbi:class I SAM-dependent methyltransferase, partial [bacterium]|nr:class I SAM-dependent methyltransferase [bacterium]